MSARLWVTGVGLVTALGVGVEATWARLLRGERAIGPVRGFDASGQRVAIAAEVDGVRAAGPSWSRTSAMAASASREAMTAARLDVRAGRVGLVVATTTGGMLENEELLARLHADPGRGEVLAAMLSHPISATADRLEEDLGPFVRARTASSACSSGATAVIVAASWLLGEEVDAVVVCASDALCRLTLSGFNALGALDPEPCRPFDRRRRGTSLGEGAGALVLERADAAVARGASPVAELAGWAAGSEAHHITNPAPDGALVEALVGRALARAGLRPAALDYVSAHGTGTPLGDPIEAAALARALGPEAARVPVSSSKAQIGHTLGAAGAIEAVFAALAVQRGALPPTAGLEEPDPAIPLVHVPGVGRAAGRVRAALSSALGFGGMDAMLVLAAPGLGREHDTSTGGGVVVTGAALAGPFGVLGAAECATLDGTIASAPAVDPGAHLDPLRARRLDAAARLALAAVGRALAGASDADASTGLVLGSAFGSVDASAEFMHRLFDRGPRAARPADFPGLVPSAPVGHASIYLGLRGPAFSTADLATSGESAFCQAVQMVAAGEAGRLVAGSAEARGDIVERVLGALFADGAGAGATRRDLAAAVVVEAEGPARARGVRVLARVKQVLEWRADPARALAALEQPSGPASEVVLARACPRSAALVASGAWGGCRRVEVPPALGPSEAMGAAAIALAAARVGAGVAGEALVVGVAAGRGFLVLLGEARSCP